jgi:hypothetical protein
MEDLVISLYTITSICISWECKGQSNKLEQGRQRTEAQALALYLAEEN